MLDLFDCFAWYLLVWLLVVDLINCVGVGFRVVLGVMS